MLFDFSIILCYTYLEEFGHLNIIMCENSWKIWKFYSVANAEVFIVIVSNWWNSYISNWIRNWNIYIVKGQYYFNLFKECDVNYVKNVR